MPKDALPESPDSVKGRSLDAIQEYAGGANGSYRGLGERGGRGGGSKEEVRGAGVDGEETYEDGSSFVGQLREGRRHGAGVWTSASEQYSGQWENDQRDGQGRQTWQDGRVYEGQFRQGKFDGQGRMEWRTPNGVMLYEGQYVDDVKHGSGKYVWPDNRMYEGQWKNGQRSGRATYTNSIGQSRVGIWREDKVEKWLEESESEDKGEVINGSKN